MGDLVLVTGATGYVAAHIIQQLLQKGYRVQGTVRNPDDKDRVKPIRDLASTKPADLELVKADLLDAKCWPNVVKGCRYVMHTASPFPMDNPSDASVLVRPAVEGTVNVLRACDASVKRVVLTSSVAAVHAGHDATRPPNGSSRFTESDWSNVEQAHLAYEKSKTLAEKAAWSHVANLPADKKFELAVINPSLVLGPLLSNSNSTSVKTLQRLMSGQDPMVPRKNFAICDVRDVAAGHITAMTSPAAVGHRHIISGPNLFFQDIAVIINSEFESMGYKASTKNAPYWLMRCFACFDPGARMILPSLNEVVVYDQRRMREVLNIQPRPVEQTIIDTCYSLVEKGFVERKPQFKPKK